MKKIVLVVVSLFILVLAGCAPTSAPPPEESSTGPDPVVVDSDHYKVEFENDRVRVLRITYGPGEKSVMHFHPDNVGVFLTDMKGRFTLPDGRPEEAEAKTGEAVWADGGQHLPENLTDEPLELVLVELKEPLAEAGETSSTVPDATEADPDHYKVVFENDQVRVLRITYGPHEKSVMHEHPAGVWVLLTDEHMKFTLPDGETEEEHGKVGDTGWAGAGKHLPENLSDQAFEVILVELKQTPNPAQPTEPPASE